MSYKGSYLRGEKWYLMNRDADGNLKKVISEDPNKMKDVNIYLKSIEEAKKKVAPEEKEETKSKGKK